MNIAIVEDDDKYAQTIKEYLDRFSTEKRMDCTHKRFSEAVSFLEGYRSEFDIVLMDIDMPMLSGMDAARKLRELDKSVCLIFITNLAQFACDGYGVDALDFIVKPVSYADFSMKFARAATRALAASEREFLVPVAGGVYRIVPANIFYVEIISHKALYHTAEGTIESRETLSSIEDRLKANKFIRIGKSFLVNPRHISRVEGLKMMVGGDELFISHGRRREVIAELAAWQSGR